jgi:hypothetical protein
MAAEKQGAVAPTRHHEVPCNQRRGSDLSFAIETTPGPSLSSARRSARHRRRGEQQPVIARSRALNGNEAIFPFSDRNHPRPLLVISEALSAPSQEGRTQTVIARSRARNGNEAIFPACPLLHGM